MPSARLEQEAHILGLRDRSLQPSTIDSPQQMQILGRIVRTLNPSYIRATRLKCRTDFSSLNSLSPEA
jgi:hypothetical protein